MKKLCIVCFIVLLGLSFGCGKKKVAEPVEKPPEVPEIVECSSDMLMVSKKFCIDINESPEAEFSTARDSCKKQNKHLCKENEWAISCVKSNDIKDMKNNWEWVDKKDEDGNYYIIGDGGCGSHNYSSPSGSFGYRCCM